MRKFMTVIFAICIVFNLAMMSVLAEGEASGTCGKNVTWSYDKDTLTISGTGAMEDFDASPYSPWYQYSDSIKAVVITDGVTSIGDFAFENYYRSLISVSIPSSVTSIGKKAFCVCCSLKSLIIPNSVTTIGEGAFGLCESLTNVQYTGTQAQWNNILISEGNEDLTRATIQFESNASIWFTTDNDGQSYTLHIDGEGECDLCGVYSQYDEKIDRIEIGSGFTSIPGEGLLNWTDAESITIPSSVTEIAENAFCNNSEDVSIQKSSDTQPEEPSVMPEEAPITTEEPATASGESNDGKSNILIWVIIAVVACGIAAIIRIKDKKKESANY